MNFELLVARKRIGLSQKELGEKAGLGQGDVSRIESADWLPPTDVRQRLAEALGVEVETLFPTVVEG